MRRIIPTFRPARFDMRTRFPPTVQPGLAASARVELRDWNWTSGSTTGWKRLWQVRELPKGRLDSVAATADTRGTTRREPRLARVEALLFVAREPLSSRKIAQLVNLADGTEARTLIRRLNQMFDESGSAFRVEEVAGGFQLMTQPRFGNWLRRLLGTTVETRLSAQRLRRWRWWPIGNPCCVPSWKRSAACSAAISCDN